MNQPYNHSVIQFLTAYNRKLNYEIQKRLDLFQSIVLLYTIACP